MKFLVLKFPINTDETIVEFDESKYKKQFPGHRLADKKEFIQDDNLVLVYEIKSSKLTVGNADPNEE